MKRIARGFVELVRRTESAWLQALLRMLFGAAVVYCISDMVALDLVRVLWLGPESGGISRPNGSMWLVGAVGGPDAAHVWALVVGCGLAGALTVVGLGGRWVPLVTALLYYAVRSLNPPVTGGYDALMVNALFYIGLGRPTATCSVDAFLRRRWWRAPDARVPSWPRYLLAFQVIILYTATGLKKGSVVWSPADGYTALYYIFMDPTWRRFEPDFLRWALPLSRVGTAITWHWEQSAPILLLAAYFRHTEGPRWWLRSFFERFDVRLPWLAIGLALHIGILLSMNVGPFSWVSLAFYPALFGPDELERLAAPVRRSVLREP